MPTAARLAAAILLTIVAVMAASAYKLTLPEGQPTRWLLPICAILGIWHGWMTLGRNVGKGWVPAINTGVKSAFLIGFFAVLIFGLYEMFYRSTRLYYDDPGEATIAAIDLFMEYGMSLLLAFTAMGILFIGGVIAALITELVDRRWS